MDYSKETAQLLDKLDRIAMLPYRWHEEEIISCLKKFYKHYGMEFPKAVEKCADIFDSRLKGLLEKQARQVRQVRQARQAGQAGQAWQAWQAWQAGQARQAWQAWQARQAGQAGQARQAWQAWQAGQARQAQDYASDLFESWLVFSEEFSRTDKINEHDIKFIEGQRILLEAKEHGLGFFFDDEEGTLYLVPCAVAKLDDGNVHNSEVGPAIEWVGGEKLYYLHGVYFEEELWVKVVSGKMAFKEIIAIENVEQRLQAMRHNPRALMQEKPILIHKSERGNELWVIEGSEVNKFYDAPKVWLLGFIDPSKKAPNNKIYEEADPEMCERNPNADYVNAEHCKSTLEEYMAMEYES